MQHVLVIDKNKMFLMPCHPARARELLRKGKAAVYKRCPFSIILKEKSGGDVQDLELKLDPGSKTTTIALVAECQQGESAGYEAREYLCKWFIAILARARAPSKDGAASNSIRYATGGRLQAFGLQVSFWAGGGTSITGRTKATEYPIGLTPFASDQQAGVSIFRRDCNPSMFLLWAEDHGRCAGWITTVFLERQRKQEELSRDGKPGIRSRHWSTKAKSPGRMLAGCLCESPAVSIARQKRVQYRGFHGNIALFCSVPMVTTTT